MRRLILSALVLLPVLASAQTSTSAAKPSDAATLQAKLTPPAAMRPVAATAPAAAPSADSVMVPVHETIIDNSLGSSESAGYSFTAGRPVAPKLIYSVPLQLSLKDMRSEPDTATTIVVRLTVNADGTAGDLSIAQSGGATLDKRALEAAAQYRFQPATENNVPVAATATIAFTLKKS